MKTKLLLLAGLLWLGLAAQAQNGGFMQQRGERIEEVRRRFIKERAALTADEEAKFWPIYWDYQDALKRLKLDTKAKTISIERGIDNLTDAQVDEIIQAMGYQQQQEARLLDDYLAKVRKVLPGRKVVKVYQAEREFVRELLRRLRERGAAIPPELEGDN